MGTDGGIEAVGGDFVIDLDGDAAGFGGVGIDEFDNTWDRWRMYRLEGSHGDDSQSRSHRGRRW